MEGITEDFAKTSEFGSKGGSRTGLFQARKFVLKLGATLSVLVENSELFEESIIVSEQWRVRFKESLTPFGRGATKKRKNEGDARFVVVFSEGNGLHADIELALLKEGGKF